MNNNYIKNLQEFLDSSTTAFQSVEVIKGELEKNGFQHLKESEKWSIEKGKKYYITRNDSSLIAIEMGRKSIVENGVKIVGAHTDSPSMKIKPKSQKRDGKYLKVSVEVYGGPILATWLDRELSIAGRVVIKKDDSFETRIVDFKEPLAIIPNMAIHMNRKVNKDFEYNKQKHLAAIISTVNEVDMYLDSLIAKKLGVDKNSIVDFDLFFYDYQRSHLVGAEHDMLASGRLDNLQMCHAALKGILESKDSSSTKIAAFYDNEEIGSRTPQGANSSFMESILRRIIESEASSHEDYSRAIANSFLISADGAHAYHPNFASKHDPHYKPVINGGPVIKINANYRYTSTAESSVYFANLCKKADVPCQRFIIKSDMPCGSTIGPMSAALLGIDAVDVGNAMWAMHSIRETCGTKDHVYMIKVLKEFYGE